MTNGNPAISGYRYGQVGRSPVTLEDLHRLEETVGFTSQDRETLAALRGILSENAEALVNGWREIIGSQEHLAKWFYGPDGKPSNDYKAAVKLRFVQWVVDLCTRPFDQQWLDYQEEIGLRHTPAKKNATDGANTPPLVPLRYLLAFTPRVLDSIRTLLQAKGLSAQEINRAHSAWTKAVILTITLWSRPYTRDELW
jgi:Protoglobin